MNHGTVHGYHEGCRCDPCKSAQSRYAKANRLAIKARAAKAYWEPELARKEREIEQRELAS